DEQGKHYVGFRVVNRTEEQHRKLIYHMFGSAEAWHHDQTALTPLSAYKSFIESPMRLSTIEQMTFRRRSPRFRASLQVRLFSGSQDYSATTIDVSESGMLLMMYHPKENLLQSRVDIQIQWSNGNVGTLQGVVKRVDPMLGTPGAFKLALNFVELSREQRQALIGQLFGPRPGVVRVAPPSHMMVGCKVQNAQGQTMAGVTQEVSEMGIRLLLNQSLPVEMHEEVSVMLHWEQMAHHGATRSYPDTPSAQAPQPKVYKTIVVGYQHPSAANPRPELLLYFKDINLQSLDEISHYLHQSNTLLEAAQRG
ncbi:MAG: PilZ domain-containing protein, partial [Vampirovibrionales bacterium]